MTTIAAQNRERWGVWLLCALAAIRVFLYAAAFPFFNPIDEEYHFDLVVKYSQGRPPHGLDALSDEARSVMVLYSSDEYFAPEIRPDGKSPPPLWRLPQDVAAPEFRVRYEAGRNVINHEAGQPPLYYLVAGLVWRLGAWLRCDEGTMLYNLRFLNVIFIIGLVWLGHVTARTLFPESRLLRIGVPALLAFLPQSAFYGIENDVLSPLCCGTAFLCVLRWVQGGALTFRLAITIGLALSAAVLVKLTNAPFVAVMVGVIVWQIRGKARSTKLKLVLPALTLLGLLAGLPVLLWLGWMKHRFGDFTGEAAKVHSQGWTYNTFAQRWHHPLFTPTGLWAFISRLVSTFWQGELAWHSHPLTSSARGFFYTLLTLGGLGLTLASLGKKFLLWTPEQRRVLWLAFASVGAGVAFLGYLSTCYDFQGCINPSREHPFFSGGRLLLGIVIPLFVLMLAGVDSFTKRSGHRTIALWALAILILFMAGSEAITLGPVFGSEYNWFHL